MTREQVTLKDVYDIVFRMQDTLEKRLSKDEDRIDTLENSNSKLVGTISILSVLGTAVFSWFWNRIGKSI